MVSNSLIFLVIVSLISQSLQNVNDNEIEVEETNPFKEAASDVKKEQNQQNIGGLIKNIMDNGGKDLFGSFLSEFAKENSGQLLEGLGSLLASQKQDKKSGTSSDTPNVLESIGAIANLMGNLEGLKDNQQGKGKEDGAAALLKGLGSLGSLLGQGGQGNGDGGAALLQGLGSLLGQVGQGGEQGHGGEGAALLKGLGSLLSQGGNGGQGGEGAALLKGLGSLLGQGAQGGQGGEMPDLEMLGSMLNYFSQGEEEKGKPKEKSTASKEAKKINSKAQPDFNMNDILALVSNFLGQPTQKGGKKQENNFLTMIPSILQTLNAFIGPEADSRAKSHEGHSSLMPPVLEKLHIMFDHFIHSEIGQNVITALGAEKSFKVFLDDKGRFSYKKFGEMMENHSYRRQWIRIVTDRAAAFLHYASNPKVYKSYISGAQLFFNSYLKSLGFPKSTLFDISRPVETMSAFVNYAAKKYFEVKVNSKEYVKPAVAYIKDLLKLAESSGTLKRLSNSDELSNKLADTINLEIIEPLARVNRAYRFASSVPKCERYVLCLVNEESQNELESLPGLKKLLHKGSSLLAGWFLSSRTGTPFWTLYTDITENINCKKLYSSECEGFHVEELRVTTEYVHSEL